MLTQVPSGAGWRAFVDAGSPVEADLVEPKLLERGAEMGEGKERGADIVEIAGQRRFERIERAARTRLRFEDADAPAGLGQGQRRRQAVGTGADHDCVVQVLPFTSKLTVAVRHFSCPDQGESAAR